MVTILFQLLAGLIFGLTLIPSVWLVFWAWQTTQVLGQFWSVFFISISIGVGYFIFCLNLMISIVIVRNLFRIHNQEGRTLIFSFRAFKFGVYSFLIVLVRKFSLPFVRSSPIINLFYRGMGAKIGKNTLIGTDRIWDCDMIEIGDNCIIGGNVAINAHIGQGQKGRMRRVRIGNGVTIGADSLVMPGVVIEDNVLVGPNSVVPMGKRLKANSVYLGTPVERIADRAEGV